CWRDFVLSAFERLESTLPVWQPATKASAATRQNRIKFFMMSMEISRRLSPFKPTFNPMQRKTIDEPQLNRLSANLANGREFWTDINKRQRAGAAQEEAEN